jgi:hypothetical protein
MSWKASAFVKPLTHHKDGTRLSAREKLILFVLADSHNDARNCAWISITLAAKDALTSRSRFIELIKRLESKGTIRIERRIGMSSLYFFPDLPVRESDPPVVTTRPIATGPHPSDSCRTQASIEPPEEKERENITYAAHTFSPPGFKVFWEAYPYKRDSDPQEARNAWFKSGFAEREWETVLAGLELWKASDEWKDERLIPSPEKFIRGKRWQTFPPRKKVKGKDLQQQLNELEAKHGLGKQAQPN